MTQYHGGKFAIGQTISGIMTKYIKQYYGDWDEFDQYVEPFVGMAGVLRHIPHENRIASDRDKELISMWKAVKRGWLPEKTWRKAHISKREYNKMKQNPKYRKPFERGFAKYAISYGGMEWSGFMTDTRTPNFNFGLRDSVIYLDPPYEGTAGYRGEKFDHTLFWEKVEDWADDGNIVFISECAGNFPKWVKIIWKKKWMAGHGNLARAKKKTKFHVEALGVVDFN